MSLNMPLDSSVVDQTDGKGIPQQQTLVTARNHRFAHGPARLSKNLTAPKITDMFRSDTTVAAPVSAFIENTCGAPPPNGRRFRLNP
jgi:hypothetical protein